MGRAPEDTDTARLVGRFQAGDRDAFSEIYSRYFDRVYNYLRLLLRDSHEAEDVSQQAFMDVARALPGYDGDPLAFRPWLFAVVRNRALNQLRKGRRAEVVDPRELDSHRERAGGELEAATLAWITDQDLLILIERLPIPQRQALLLRFMLDLDAAEVGEILDRRPADVRLLQHRALGFLRDRLTALGRAPRRGERARMGLYRKQAGVVRLRKFVLR